MSAEPPASVEPREVTDGELVLRPLSMDDVAQIGAAATDPEIARWNRIGPTAQEWVAQRADWSAGDHVSWAIARRVEPATLMGAISLHHLDREQSNGEAGYWVAPAYRGQHVGARALLIASGFGFGQLGLHRIQLFHVVQNHASCAVAQRAGFLLEGTHRQSWRLGDGAWYDEHCHARLSTDSS